MGSYRSVTHDLRDYIGGQTVSPDSVIINPLPVNHILVGSSQPFSSGNNFEGVQIILKEVMGEPNPKWVRDSWIVSVQALGEDRSKFMKCEDLIGSVIFNMVGNGPLYIGDRVYVQMSSNQLPKFVGYLDNSKPMFSATLDFVVEGTKDDYNRKAMN